jgi:hypothetical protein
MMEMSIDQTVGIIYQVKVSKITQREIEIRGIRDKCPT